MFFYHFSLNLEHSINLMYLLNFYTYSKTQFKDYLPNEDLSGQINITSLHLYFKKMLVAIFLEFILQLMITQSALLW
jgi:branched-subunit amino acid transport protein AzlD